jgi:hypothetical protein
VTAPENHELKVTPDLFNEAVDWLLNSRFMDPEAITIFWAIADGDVRRNKAEEIPVDVLRKRIARREAREQAAYLGVSS